MASISERLRHAGPVRARRYLVLAIALVATVVKLRIAATTFGTSDVRHWADFGAAVRHVGPIDIYATRYRLPYNHPPLTGWLLVLLNGIASHGPSYPFLIRVPASLADVVTSVLVFELVRRVHSLRNATIAACVVAISPVLIFVSGFHGNTDPVFAMFIIASAYLVLTDRPVAAGVAAAAAVSIKLVPVVALPVLAAAVWRDPRRLFRLALGFLALFLPLWVPVVLRQWAGFKRNVLDYRGISPAQTRWGIVDFARHAHQSGLVDFLVGPGRFAAIAISALVPAILVLRRPADVATGVALSLVLFLLLTTTFGTQYLAWAAAGALFCDLWLGGLFNVTAGIMLAVIYTHWSDGFPWNVAIPHRLTGGEEAIGWLVWVVLLAGAVVGVRRLKDRPITEYTSLPSTMSRTDLTVKEGA